MKELLIKIDNTIKTGREEIIETVNKEEEIINNIDKAKNTAKEMRPQHIYAELNQYIIGQEEAKKTISIAIHNHLNRVNMKKIYNLLDIPIRIDKNNLIFVGPTGCGKTEIIKYCEKIFDIPIVICDASALTEAGYIGENVESIIEELLHKTSGDISCAERGIVYIDEIDKLSVRNNEQSVGNEGVQQALLKLIEGTHVTISARNARSQFQTPKKINTEDILFILGGAFPGIDNIVSKRMKEHKEIGFSLMETKTERKNEDFYQFVIPADLITYGLLPELVGRTNRIVHFHPLTDKHLIQILSDIKFSILEQLNLQHKFDNIKFSITQKAKQYIADTTIEMKVGARGLRSIIENTISSEIYTIPEDDCQKMIILDYLDNHLVAMPVLTEKKYE
jgi:ATP-dependent Clp protease ATP-binding subunit ClpX